eukprot:529822_1
MATDVSHTSTGNGPGLPVFRAPPDESDSNDCLDLDVSIRDADGQGPAVVMKGEISHFSIHFSARFVEQFSLLVESVQSCLIFHGAVARVLLSEMDQVVVGVHDILREKLAGESNIMQPAEISLLWDGLSISLDSPDPVEDTGQLTTLDSDTPPSPVGLLLTVGQCTAHSVDSGEIHVNIDELAVNLVDEDNSGPRCHPVISPLSVQFILTAQKTHDIRFHIHSSIITPTELHFAL